ncbi:MAG: restriction endonuclease subunit S, partial [Deltaproteobacteria bacterium]|nr:restriction endonuclease subunit S [Deltaproteobacteria bacterium]
MMVEKNRNDLPEGWVWTKLVDVSLINPRFKEENIPGDIDVSFLPMRAVQELSGKIDLSLTRKLSQVKKRYTAFIEGDLLFAKITPCMENGKIAIAKNLHNGMGFGSTEFHVIRLSPLLNSKFFFFFLIQDAIREDARKNMKGTAGQLRVPSTYLEQISIPLPPLHEQHRIVAKIEELFSYLDAGVAALKKAKAQLKLYRQAVLKAAFEGRLTAAWREAHKGELESPITALRK